MLPFVRTSDTSVAAAEARADAAPTLRGAVFAYLSRRGRDGATDEQAQRAIPMNPNTYRPRRIELVRLGLVLDSGRTRPASSGRASVVWIAAPFADADPNA